MGSSIGRMSSLAGGGGRAVPKQCAGGLSLLESALIRPADRGCPRALSAVRTEKRHEVLASLFVVSE
jgi:hypothetical protein